MSTPLPRPSKQADDILLATDPDREGEAIAWHIAEILKSRKLLKGKKVQRVVFYEITESAVQGSGRNPRDISMQLVNAQQARRALDYLVGFNLSPLLWKKIRRGLSAGRVQSPALRLIVERETRDRGVQVARILDDPPRRAQKGSMASSRKLIHFRARNWSSSTIANAGAQQEVAGILLAASARQGSAESRSREEAASSARPRRAVHHLHAAAGSRAQARLHHRPRHAHRTAAL